MAEITLNINNYGVIRFRLEATDICGAGTATAPLLRLPFKAQLTSVPGPPALEYTLIRLAGRIAIAQPGEEQIAAFEAPPLAERSGSQVFDRQLVIDVPIGLGAAKRIEDARDGKDPFFRVWLTALAFVESHGFRQLTNSGMDLQIPRSHWIDRVLSVWRVSDIRLLEVRLPSTGGKEFVTAQQRLAKAEQEYRTGNYPQVLGSLRLAFEALATAHGANRADKNFFDKMLAGRHEEIREKLKDSFADIYSLLHKGPHEPVSAADDSPPIGRQEARFALVAVYAVFEYFSRSGWPPI